MDFQGQMEQMYADGRSLTERTWQAATGTQPVCEPPTRESPMAGLNAPTVALRPDGSLLGVQARNATCVAVAVHQRGPDLHHKWDDFSPPYRQIRYLELTTRSTQTLPVTVTAVGPGGTTVITGEQALQAGRY